MEHRAINRINTVVSLCAGFLVIVNAYTAETRVITKPMYAIKFVAKQNIIDLFGIDKETFDLLKKESTVIRDLTTDTSITKIPLAREYVDRQTLNLILPLLRINTNQLHEQLNRTSPENLIKIIRAADYLDIAKLKRPLLNNRTLARLVTYCSQNPHVMGTLPMVAQDSMLSPLVSMVMNSIEQIISEMTDQQVTVIFGDKLVDKPFTTLPLEARILSIRWSPDSLRFVTSTRDNRKVSIWNFTVDSKLLHTLHLNTSQVHLVAWSPDGTHLATIPANEGLVSIWKAADGTLLRTLHGLANGVGSVAFSPDGRYLAIGGSDDTRIWNATDGTLLHTLQGHAHWITSIAWSPDGQHIVTGSMDKTARIWNATTGAPLHTLQGHTNGVLSIAWSPDGTQIATGSRDKTARIWNANNGLLIHMLQGHTNAVESVAFRLPGGRYLATGSADKTARIWNADNGTLLHTLQRHTNSSELVAWNPDGTYLAAAQKGIINRGAEDYDDGTARIWNIALLEKLEHIAQQMNGTQIIAAWSITQQPSADIATSMLEILPTQLIDILITKASVPVSEKLKEILQKRYLKDIVEKAQPQRDLQEQIQPLEKFRQRILEQKKERQSTEQQTKRIMSGKEEYNDMPHRMPGTRTKSLLQRPKYKLLD